MVHKPAGLCIVWQGREIFIVFPQNGSDHKLQISPRIHKYSSSGAVLCLVVKGFKRCNLFAKKKLANKKIEIFINHSVSSVSLTMPVVSEREDFESRGCTGNDGVDSEEVGCFGTLNCEAEVGSESVGVFSGGIWWRTDFCDHQILAMTRNTALPKFLPITTNLDLNSRSPGRL